MLNLRPIVLVPMLLVGGPEGAVFMLWKDAFLGKVERISKEVDCVIKEIASSGKPSISKQKIGGVDFMLHFPGDWDRFDRMEYFNKIRFAESLGFFAPGVGESGLFLDMLDVHNGVYWMRSGADWAENISLVRQFDAALDITLGILYFKPDGLLSEGLPAVFT